MNQVLQTPCFHPVGIFAEDPLFLATLWLHDVAHVPQVGQVRSQQRRA